MILTEKNHTAEFLLSEGCGQIAREQITLAITADALVAGTVLAQNLLGAATAAAKAGGNTGTGTLTMDATTPVLAGAKRGVYTIRCVSVTAGAEHDETFNITDPDGFLLGEVTVVGVSGSVTFGNDIKFALTDGATDFIVGDGFDVAVAAGNGQYLAYADATAATLPATAVLYASAPASGAAQQATAIVRLAEVAEDRLTGLTATARASLAAHGIVIR